MPYIKQEKRDVLDPAIDQLLNTIRELESDDPANDTEGNLNYIISKILDRLYVANYKELNNALGVLSAIAFEYYRRVGAPLENQASFDNGEVYDALTAQDAVEAAVADQE